MHGFESVVGPVKGVFDKETSLNKAREHSLLRSDRPAYVTILSLGNHDTINTIFSYQSMSIIITINVKSLFLSSLKSEFCSKVKVVETRLLIFLNKINIQLENFIS